MAMNPTDSFQVQKGGQPVGASGVGEAEHPRTPKGSVRKRSLRDIDSQGVIGEVTPYNQVMLERDYSILLAEEVQECSVFSIYSSFNLNKPALCFQLSKSEGVRLLESDERPPSPSDHSLSQLGETEDGAVGGTGGPMGPPGHKKSGGREGSHLGSPLLVSRRGEGNYQVPPPLVMGTEDGSRSRGPISELGLAEEGSPCGPTLRSSGEGSYPGSPSEVNREVGGQSCSLPFIGKEVEGSPLGPSSVEVSGWRGSLLGSLSVVIGERGLLGPSRGDLLGGEGGLCSPSSEEETSNEERDLIGLPPLLSGDYESSSEELLGAVRGQSLKVADPATWPQAWGEEEDLGIGGGLPPQVILKEDWWEEPLGKAGGQSLNVADPPTNPKSWGEDWEEEMAGVRGVYFGLALPPQ